MDVDYKHLVLEELNYNSYLQIPELLSLQHQVSEGPHHDEMFFIIIHQSAELWFKELLHESSILVDSFRENTVSRSIKVLKRLSAVMNLQVQQIRLLSTLTPVEFSGFREYLRPASGFQSAQFRIMEFKYGIREAFFLRFFEKSPHICAELERIRQEPSVYDEFMQALKREGYKVPEELLLRDVTLSWECNEDLTKLIGEIYENPRNHYHWVLLCEALIDLDEAFCLWRKTHATMVNRTIGAKTGTGGSAGFDFLQSRENLKMFPELWNVRNIIGGSY